MVAKEQGFLLGCSPVGSLAEWVELAALENSVGVDAHEPPIAQFGSSSTCCSISLGGGRPA